MHKRLWFKTGDPGADAGLRRVAALADPRAHPVPNGLALEDWIEQVLREIRSLPADLIRSLKPEALYCWDAPRRWEQSRAVAWHGTAAAGLLERLTGISRPAAEDAAPISLSLAMGITYDYRHSLRDGLRALYSDHASVPPPMLEQVARIAVTQAVHEAAAPTSHLEHSAGSTSYAV